MMLHNRFAGSALQKLDRLYEAGIQMNGQIVLCKGVNDGEELERTISDLSKYLPYMESVSVVPVGLSKYREGLYPLEPFTKEDAKEVIKTIEKWQDICRNQHGMHFIHASDEWYLLAGVDLPEEDRYDGYIQLENGVGMLRLLINEFTDALQEYVEEKREELMERLEQKLGGSYKITLATGRLAAPFLEKLASDFMTHFPGYEVEVVPIRNDFFGERITVSGLITGQDLLAQLRGMNLGNAVGIPCNMLRSGENVFLDDVTVAEIEKTLQRPIVIVKSSGQDLLDAMLGLTNE
jgi:putative radical SAM enzyme (TIGR03279 family)